MTVPRKLSWLYGCTILLVVATATAADYHPITPTASSEVITLTGHDLTIDQLIAVARYGARVQYSPDALQHAAEARDLRAEAGAENIPVYGLNRGSGALREVKSSEAHPADTQVLPMLGAGALPEIADEDLVRAVLVISANTAPLGPAQPETMTGASSSAPSPACARPVGSPGRSNLATR